MVQVEVRNELARFAFTPAASQQIGETSDGFGIAWPELRGEAIRFFRFRHEVVRREKVGCRYGVM